VVGFSFFFVALAVGLVVAIRCGFFFLFCLRGFVVWVVFFFFDVWWLLARPDLLL